VAFGMGASVMAFCALIFLVGRHALPWMYSSDASVLELAARVLPIAAAFQLFDGLQVVGSGILRGMGRPIPGAVINLVGYYALAKKIGGGLQELHDSLETSASAREQKLAARVDALEAKLAAMQAAAAQNDAALAAAIHLQTETMNSEAAARAELKAQIPPVAV